jgi:hypothetical protein
MVLDDKLVTEDGRVFRRSATLHGQARNLEAFSKKLFSLLKFKMTLLKRAKDNQYVSEWKVFVK